MNEIAQSKRKDIRILESFDAILASKRLFVHRNIIKTPFLMEIREWKPSEGSKGSSKYHDDGLDAVAGAIAQQPDRLTRLHRLAAQTGSRHWMDGANAHKAKTDFDV